MTPRYVLGAPGAGKTTVQPLLRAALPGQPVLDWDDLMDAAGALAGRPIRAHPDTWPAYGELVRAVLAATGAPDPVLLLVCTPDELPGWPAGEWLLLDCPDDERRRRLLARGAAAPEIDDALADAAAYRALGLPAVDGGRTAAEVAQDLAARVSGPRPHHS